MGSPGSPTLKQSLIGPTHWRTRSRALVKCLWREDHKARAQLRLLGCGLLPTTAYVYPPGFRQQRARRARKFKHLAVRLPLVALYLRRSSRFAVVARPALALHAACNLVCNFAITVLLPSLLIWVGPGSSRVPIYLVGDIVAY